MVVRTRSRNGRMIGLDVGAANARRHFPKSASRVSLELGHLHIDCALTPDFWEDRAEICDARLADWLESNHLRPRTNPSPVFLIMTRIGESSFALRPAVQRPCPRTTLLCPMRSCSGCPVDKLRME